MSRGVVGMTFLEPHSSTRPEAYNEFAVYDGSVIPERTKGEMSTRCEGEEFHFLALNLANDICTGKVDAEKAILQ